MDYRNATFAFVGELSTVLERGKPVKVRGKGTKELLARTVALSSPRERLITVPGRRNDVFATIAEVMWVLAGRDDVEFLRRYLHRAPDFSDDGLVWRAAYGPRLRDWQGVDQVDEVRKLLLHDPESRRAVAALFDPARDFLRDTQDVPCNNWLHFLRRDGRLDMNIVVRSNDVLWGFSGINTFEWSVLHEMMAFWLGLSVGTATFFISSLHIYDDLKPRGENTLAGFSGRSGYEQGWTPQPFKTEWEDLASTLDRWFELESRLAAGEDARAEIEDFPDPMLRNFLRVIRIKWLISAGAPEETQRSLVDELGQIDLAFGLHEQLFRDSAALVGGAPTLVDPIELRDTIRLLHRSKDASYGNSWKRRGEQVSILANIARKADRLENVTGGAPAGSEGLMDTAVDLFVYSLKYQTFLADENADVASELFGGSGTGFSDGPEGFETLLPTHDFAAAHAGLQTEAAAAIDAFDQLDRTVRGGNASGRERLQAARVLTDAARRLVTALAVSTPDALQRLQREIA